MTNETPVVTDEGKPKTLDIEALLADEAAADTPVRVADLKPWLEQHTGKIVERVSSDFRARQEEQARAARASEEANASAKSDMDFAADLEKRLDSPDEAVRTAARAEKDANSERYRRGLAIGWQFQSAERAKEVLSNHLAPMWQQLKEAGYQKLIDEDFKDPDFLRRHLMPNGEVNWLKATVDAAEARGYERGKTEAADEADRARRAADGAGGPPALGNGAAGPNDDLWEGIDRTKPGAAAEYQRKLADRNAKRVGARR